MTMGVVLLVHTALHRAEQVARHWAAAGCPVVIHVDASLRAPRYAAFQATLADVPNLRFAPRHRCEWGTFSIVAATQSACDLMLREFPDAAHVYLASGSCLPLRPVSELVAYLAARPHTDFIESATTADVPWTVGGLSGERFTLRFPFAWKRQRALFDRYVAIQRRLNVHRRLPNDVIPHMGSQWWCLTRGTLSAILDDPDRARYDRFFRRVWIPDESYFQTLARLWSHRIESRSLTLSKFDFEGRPHVFYDDHLDLLRRSECFVARKIWPRAAGLYAAFLTDADHAMDRAEPNPGKIDRLFARAAERRLRGRPGLFMQSRFPDQGPHDDMTAAPYGVYQGFADLFEDFAPWLGRSTASRVHGHLFARERVAFAGGHANGPGGLSDSAAIRDYNPRAFLGSLVWNAPGERQSFQFGPDDAQTLCWDIAKDPNARIAVISGAWAVPLFRQSEDFAALRTEAARLQKIESAFLDILRSGYARARIRIWTMAEVVAAPRDPLQAVVADFGGRTPLRLTDLPRMRDLTGFGGFLQTLKNQGMHPYLMGDFPADAPTARDTAARGRNR